MSSIFVVFYEENLPYRPRWPGQLYWQPAEGARVVETNVHFLASFKPASYFVNRGLFTSPAEAEGARVVETNVHFVATYRPASLAVNRNLFSSSAEAEGGRVVETNPHFVAQFRPVTYLIDRRLFGAPSEGARVAETNVHFLAQFRPASYFLDRRLISAPSEGATVAETNTHFGAGFRSTSLATLPLLRQNSDTTVQVVVAETNTHFVASYRPATYLFDRRLFGAPSEGATVAETNPHFLARYVPASLTVDRRLLGAPAEGGRVVETNVQTPGRFVSAALTVPVALRQNAATDTFVAAAVAETNVHFLASFRQSCSYSRFLYNHWDTSVPQFDEAAPHAVGTFSQDALNVSLGLIQNPATDVTAVVAQPETNTHFVASFRPATYLVDRRLFGAPSEGATVAETNVHTIGRFSPANLAVPTPLRQNAATDRVVVEGGQEFIVSVRQPAYRSFWYNSWSESQPETNTHFLAHFKPVSYFLNRALFGAATDTFVAAVVAETNVHFLASFRQPGSYSRFLYNHWDTSVPQAESNSHTIVNFLPTYLSVLPGLRQNSATDGFAATAVVETNTHFVASFRPASYFLDRRLFGASAEAEGGRVTETNVHFLASFRPASYRVNRALFGTSSEGGFVVETNVHTLARFNPVVYWRFSYNTWDTGVPQAETNVQFIASFRPATYFIDRRLISAPAEGARIAETNVHTVGKFKPVSLAVPSALRQNAATDFITTVVSETNTHFVARFTSVSLIVNRNLFSAEAEGGRVTETNVHTIASFRPASYRVSRDLFGSAAEAEGGRVSETNVHFLGRFQPSRLTVPAALRQNSDTVVPVVVVAETNTHFLATYRPAFYRVRRDLFGASAESEGGRVVETNPHFLARFIPTVLTNPIFLRQNSAEGATVAETNVHFLASYRPDVYKLFRYDSWDTGVPQPETNVHFLARHQPAALTVNRNLFSSPAEAEGGFVVETNVLFLARFRAAKFDLLHDLWMLPATDFKFITSPNPQFGQIVGRRRFGANVEEVRGE